jgi:hypothetical protein
MIKHVVNLSVPNAKAEEFYDFMINPDPALFHRWLPEEHHAFHIVKRSPTTPLGDLVYYDEILGSRKYRLAFYATISEVFTPNKVVFRMRKFGVNLPAYLDLEFVQDGEALKVRHEVRIENDGLWKAATPIVQLVCTPGFWEALQGHCDREWIALRDVMNMREESK